MKDIDVANALYRENLNAFTCRSFGVIEPSTNFQYNWHIGCIADHLQAVWTGEIRNLIINMPPRSLKTHTTSVAFPAWGLGKDPAIRFMLTSFKSSLAEKMTRKTRMICKSDWYKNLFPNAQVSDELDRQYYFETTQGGQYFSSAMPSVTGEGCDIQICFPYDEIVHTEQGRMKIGDIVTKRLGVMVWSYNNGQELRPVYGWKRNPASIIYKVILNDGRTVRCTPDHKFLTTRGMIEAQDLLPTDMLPRLSSLYAVDRALAYAKYRLKLFVGKIGIYDLQNLLLGKGGISYQGTFGCPVSGSQIIGKFSPYSSSPYGVDSATRQSVFVRDSISVSGILEDRNSIVPCNLGARSVFGKWKCSEFFSVSNVFRSCAVSDIINRVQGFISVNVTDVMPIWPWSDKGKCHGLMNIKNGTLSVFSCINAQISMAIDLWLQNPFLKRMKNFAVPCLSALAFYSSKVGNTIASLKSGYAFPLFVGIDGHAEETFCLSVEGNHNFYCGSGQGIVISNCDDPLNPDEALSDTIREKTIETIRGTLFSRFNDPRTGRFVLNMQRLHDADPTGEMLKDEGWVHLKLPAEALNKTYHIALGDKRWELKQGDMLFPERFTREVLDKARIRLGEYNYAGQYLQEPVPLGGGMLKPDWIQFYKQGGIKPKTMNTVILVDPAGGDEREKDKKDKQSDWTAMMVVGLGTDNNYYLLDIIRDRLNPTERIDMLFVLHRKWNALCGKPPKVGYEKYSMQSDIHYIEKKKREDAYNFHLIPLGGQKSKTARVSVLVPDMENGRWYFPESLLYIDGEGKQWDLVREMLKSEMPTFPRSKHDDMLDAMARVYEPDLCMAFPRQKISMTEKAVMGYNDGLRVAGWEEF